MTSDFLSQLGIWFLAFQWYVLTLNYLPIVDHLQKGWQCQSFLFCCTSKRYLDRVWKVYLLICTILLEFLDNQNRDTGLVHIRFFVVVKFCLFGLLWVVSQIVYTPDPYLEEDCFNVIGVDWPLYWCTKCKYYLYAFSWASWVVSPVLLEATCTEASFGSWFIVDDFLLYNPAKWNTFLASVLYFLIYLSGFPLVHFCQLGFDFFFLWLSEKNFINGFFVFQLFHILISGFWILVY